MRLEKLIIDNFRSYEERTEISFNDLTTIIGKNDVGKSTLLEALEIFFNNQDVKIDQKDCNVNGEKKEITIGCVFSDYPREILLDETVRTSLSKEYLLNEDNLLEIHKVYDSSKTTLKPEIRLVCYYPDDGKVNNKYFIQLTQSELLQQIKSRKIECNKKINSVMRENLFDTCNINYKSLHHIQLSKGDSDVLMDKIAKELPVFTLFQADRPSLDGDNEVQDPMKSAIKEAIEEVRNDLIKIETTVQEKALGVAKETISKLKEMDPTLADELIPSFSNPPKWANLFKLTLDSDKGIPLNKRGSGVRRLILLNFFRATAEKQTTKSIVYAIEEPETSQHPDNQKLLSDTLLRLSERSNTQVILTTHTPNFAESLPTDSMRLIINENESKRIYTGQESEDILEKIANTLGVYSKVASEKIISNQEIRVAIFVEGPNDISFLKNISEIVSKENSEIVNLKECENALIIPCGGDTLSGWVEDQYLAKLGIPEVHIYDKDDPELGKAPKYLKYCKKVNERNDESVAFLTSKREMENYIHSETINNHFSLSGEVLLNRNNSSDIPKLISENSEYNQRTVKKKLNNIVVKNMTYTQMKEIDTENEIEGEWLSTISSFINKK
ncbi:ATP-binding protein [Jeotgalicoccus sp. ATCC 8456]|uniref:ATP-binding protein n=1 Tax=Jeotgalicoccus sp. ATCC 8456 TaxID=946435 RepID=UPI0018E63C83|nr:ATP-binding protein [Jeotgalicoccus sp. ATCC 8456]QQD84765.1 ATP-binding protein [Jeotgalicoccus sp. ATCC 8456]